ncbi:MAG: 3-ketoacyl-ACP reductase [Promethearchaeota archaeon CR_4]|nr:MAG: 3-ketoacyl-ACP reductase [Candidatus Lokiarchaeota archaeon CR_4]
MDLVIGTILRGTLNSISAVLPYMIQQKYGRIVTLSGGGANRPLTHMTTYSAAKGGVVAFSKCFAMELAEQTEDIKLNIFQPGMIRTDLTTKPDVVPEWMDEEKVVKMADLALKYMGSDITEATRKVIPFVLPSCKANGKLFSGFSLLKLIRGAMKLKKMKKRQ